MENQMKPLTIEDFEYFHDREYRELEERMDLDVDDPDYLCYDEVHDGALENTIAYLIELGHTREEIDVVYEEWIND